MLCLLYAYGSTLFTLLAIDALWLTILMGATYKSAIGELMLDEPKLVPAALFYLLYAIGLVVFAIMPALREENWRYASILSALLGLIAYATYDLSNLAMLKAWSLQLTIIDITWGMVLSCIAGTVGYFVASR
jgi:uncharacterized membrane protein